MNNPNKENEEIEEWEKKFDAFWQHSFNDRGITFNYLGERIIASHRVEHPKRTVKSFIKALLSKDQKIQDLKTIPSEALIQELINRGYTKIEDISPE